MDSQLLTQPIHGYSPPVFDPKPSGNHKTVNAQLFDDGGFLLPPYRSFAGIINLFSKVYSFRFDEALRHAPQNAIQMRHDAYFAALIEERIKPLSQWEWQVEIDPDDKKLKDGKAEDREQIRAAHEAIIRRTWMLAHLREYLGEFVWTGKYGAQVVWGDQNVAGVNRKCIVRHSPVDGDKILVDFDGNPAVGIYGVDMSKYPAESVGLTDRFPVLKLNRPDFRQRFLIPMFHMRDGDYFDPTSAGRVGGVGLRHYAYWAWWLRDEMLSWVADFMEKVGSLGILIFFYDQSNPTSKANAVAAAKAVGNQNALAVPVRPDDPRCGSVDVIPANLAGVQFLTGFIGDYFESHIERLIVGQTLSGDHKGSGGLGGSGAAGFQQDTKYILLRSDAELLSACLTNDLVSTITTLNFPGCPWKFHFKLIVPNPDSDKRLDAVSKARQLGVNFEEDYVRELTGAPKPAPGARTLDDIEREKQAAQQQAAASQTMLKYPSTMQHAPELVAAMLHVGDNPQALDKLAGLANDPEQLAAVAGEENNNSGESVDGNHSVNDESQLSSGGSTAHYSWSPATTSSGHVKAVGSAEHQGQTLYGKKAEAALAAQNKAPKAEDVTQPRQPGHPAAAAGKRQPKAPPRETVNRILAASDAGTLTPDDLTELAKTLPKLSLKELKELRSYDQPWMTKTKDDIVRKLVSWAAGNADNARIRQFMRNDPEGLTPELRAAKDKASAASAGPTAPSPAASPSVKPTTADEGDTKPGEAAGKPEGPANQHAIHGKIHEQIDASPGLTDAQKSHYREAMDKVLSALPEAAKDKLAASGHRWTFHGSVDKIGKAAIGSALAREGITPEQRQNIKAHYEAFQSGKLKPGAAFLPKAGRVHVDGDLSQGYPTHEVYAHIIGHVLNGPDKAISNSAEWQDAYASEIKGKLNAYAGKSPSEGMAEFSRLAFSGKATPEQLHEHYPKAVAVFASHGLMAAAAEHQDDDRQPATLPTGTIATPTHGPATTTQPDVPGEPQRPILADIFHERLDLDGTPDGDHVDAAGGEEGLDDSFDVDSFGGGDAGQAEAGAEPDSDGGDVPSDEPIDDSFDVSSFEDGGEPHQVSDEAKAHAAELEQHFPQADEPEPSEPSSDDHASDEPVQADPAGPSIESSDADEVDPRTDPKQNRTLFGQPIFKSKGGKQQNTDSLYREAWRDKAEEWAAEQGHGKIEQWSGTRFKAGGKWYSIGRQDQDEDYKVEPAEAPASQSAVASNFGSPDVGDNNSGIPATNPEGAPATPELTANSHAAALSAIPVGEEGTVNGHTVVNNGNGIFSLTKDGRRWVVTAEEAAEHIGKEKGAAVAAPAPPVMDAQTAAESERQSAAASEGKDDDTTGSMPDAAVAAGKLRRQPLEDKLKGVTSFQDKERIRAHHYAESLGHDPNNLTTEQIEEVRQKHNKEEFANYTHASFRKILGDKYTSPLDKFEAEGGEPHHLTKAEYVEMMRGHRRSLGQREESGTVASPYSDYENFHEESVRDAIKAGARVKPSVLKDYPKLVEQMAGDGQKSPQRQDAAKPAEPPVHTKADPASANHHDFTNSHRHWQTTTVPEGQHRLTIRGLAAGKSARGTGKEQAYVAALTGLDPQYGFVRKFLPSARLAPGEKHAVDVGDGVYEVQSGDRSNAPERHYIAVKGGKGTVINREAVSQHIPETPEEAAKRKARENEPDPFGPSPNNSAAATSRIAIGHPGGVAPPNEHSLNHVLKVLKSAEKAGQPGWGPKGQTPKEYAIENLRNLSLSLFNGRDFGISNDDFSKTPDGQMSDYFSNVALAIAKGELQLPYHPNDNDSNGNRGPDAGGSPAKLPPKEPKDGGGAVKGEVYPVNVKGRGTMYAVRESENGVGDSLHPTEEEAHKYKAKKEEMAKANEAYRKQVAENAEAESKASQAKQAEYENIDGFGENLSPLDRGKAVKTLNAMIKIDGKADALKSHIRDMVKSGQVTLSADEENVIKPMSKLQAFRATNEDHKAHEEKIKNAGKKIVHRVNGYDLGKTAHDYAKHLLKVKSGGAETPDHTEPPASTESIPSTPAADLDLFGDESPRDAAARAAKASDPNYAFARTSAVSNFGEDLKGSARHRANDWRGLADAEQNGTAAELVTRDNLLKAEPHGLMATIEPHNALPHLAAHLALNAFPAKPGDPDAVKRYLAGRDKDDSRQTAEGLRSQYYEAYQAIKTEAEKAAREETDPHKVNQRIHKLANKLVDRYRGIKDDAGEYGRRYSIGATDRYNPVANSLIQLTRATSHQGWGKPKATSVQGRLHDFASRAKEKYGDFTPDVLNSIHGHVQDVIEGDSFNKTFGTVGEAGKRFDPSEAYVNHAERVGGRMIDAKTVDAGRKHFMDNVKLRGLQWGNYVTDDERQHHLQKSAEAFADLADAVGLPDHAISLGGKLGLAIGARGRAGARAHYEPTTQVINLTRAQGVGSLAHEWAHAMDHHIHDFTKFASEHHTDTPVGKAMEAVRQAMSDSGFRNRLANVVRSRKDITDKKKDYWQSPEEMFARAFERHVQDKLHAQGRENTYLTGLRKVTHELWPNREESAKIAPAMDALMAAYHKHHVKG